MNIHSYPVDVRHSGDQWVAKCEELRLQTEGPTRQIAESRLLVLVYREVADRIAAQTGDMSYETGNLFLVAAVGILRKALDGSEDERAYARSLSDCLFPDLSGLHLCSPADILEYDPSSRMCAAERVGLVLAATTEPGKDLN